jgi:hypothetical protein
LNNLPSEIFEIIKDYHCDECSPLKLADIETWVVQFDEGDREFILSELLHLLKQGIYVSKNKALDLLWANFESVAKKLGYGDLKKFIYETHFFNIQKAGKSQTVLFSMLSDLTYQKLGIKLNSSFDGLVTKNFIYIDDVVATGKTLLNGLKNWLSENENTNASKIISGEYRLYISVFCMHQWALDNLKWSLKSHFKNDFFLKNFNANFNYLIDNRISYPSAKLNLAVPIRENQSQAVLDYFDGIDAENYADKAFRHNNRPAVETFFSTPENRVRFEKIILEKGVNILNQVVNKKASNRPLGATYPHYKTLGTGTLFFTWRNVSNTTPLVFWWDVPAHGWKCLFPLKGRGN